MIPTPFLDAQMQLDKRKALNVLVLSMMVSSPVLRLSVQAGGAVSPRGVECNVLLQPFLP